MRWPPYLAARLEQSQKKSVWIVADHEIKDLIRARGRVQASLTRIQTFVQQYDESQDLRMERLQEIWKKYRID
jgi:hypothetical protein